jgi:RHS repeat-associated protein
MQDGWMQWVEDVGQRVDFRFDTNMPGESFSQNAWGRLTAVEFRNSNPNTFEQFGYRYSYNQAGRVTNQRMRITPKANQQGVATTAELDASYGWDNEGRMTTQTGPSNGPTETFAYDAMGRLSTGGATYGPAGELLTFNGVTRTYNVLGQLTRMTKAGVMDMEYRYTAGQNNGRIWQSKDYVTGEEVTYQYDALNRLTAASTTDTAWGNAYGYDGWGNLKSKSVTKGTAPTLSVSYDPALNMETGSNPPSYVPWDYTLKWDAEDRPREGKAQVWAPWPPSSTGTVTYDHTGKKVFWAGGSYNPSPWEEFAACEVYFYGITGKKLARYQCKYDPNNENETGGNFGIWVADRTQHVGGQLTNWNGGGATTDRLGSLRARDAERYTYFPYGEVRTETVAGGGVYGGLESPLRVYDSGKGRFGTPDPLGMGAVKMGDPGSWNRFAYVQGDPVNFRDPKGLVTECVPAGTLAPPGYEEYWDHEVCMEEPDPLASSYFPALSTADQRTFDTAVKRAQDIVKDGGEKCDTALAKFGIPSVAKMMESPLLQSNVYDGRVSTYTQVTAKGKTVADFFKQNSTAVGAEVFVFGNGGSNNVMFLGPAFFDPTLAGVSGPNSQLAQAFIVLHEAVHLVGDKRDMDFGGSKQLTKLLVDNCFPIAGAAGWLGNLYR